MTIEEWINTQNFKTGDDIQLQAMDLLESLFLAKDIIRKQHNTLLSISYEHEDGPNDDGITKWAVNCLTEINALINEGEKK